MAMNERTVPTPNYVLLDEKGPIGPKLVENSAQPLGTVIYGFSDKAPYDAFRANGLLGLRPYPLVKGYLRNQIAAQRGDERLLVVVDATGPAADRLNAVTMESVLEAQQQSAKEVNVSSELTFDALQQAYAVQSKAGADAANPISRTPVGGPADEVASSTGVR